MQGRAIQVENLRPFRTWSRRQGHKPQALRTPESPTQTGLCPTCRAVSSALPSPRVWGKSVAEGGTGQGLSLTRGQGPSLHASKNDAAYHFITLRNRPSSTAHRRQAQTLSAALWDTGERNHLRTAPTTSFPSSLLKEPLKNSPKISLNLSPSSKQKPNTHLSFRKHVWADTMKSQSLSLPSK